MNTIKLDNVNYVELSKVRNFLNYVAFETIFVFEKAVSDDEVYYIPDGLTIKNTKFHYLIFETKFATTWTNDTNIYFTNDNEFIKNFIQEREEIEINY